MKKIILATTTFAIILSFFFLGLKPTEAKSYKIRSYKTGGTLKYQSGYFKPSSGKYVNSHFKTGPDNYKWNNRKSLFGF